jgi:hypothetical protein
MHPWFFCECRVAHLQQCAAAVPGQVQLMGHRSAAVGYGGTQGALKKAVLCGENALFKNIRR